MIWVVLAVAVAVAFGAGMLVCFCWALDEFDRMYEAGRRDEREGRRSLRGEWRTR